MPSVLVVIDSLQRGGTELHIAAIFPELHERGISVRFIVLSGTGELLEGLKGSGPDISVPPPWLANLIQKLPAVFGITLKWCFLCTGLVISAPDILTLYLPRASILGIIAHKVCRSKSRLLVNRRSLNHYQKKRPLFAKLERRLLRYVDKLVVNSEAIRSQLIREEGVEPTRVMRIYNGVTLDRFRGGGGLPDVREGLGLTNGKLVVALVANVLPYKGHADVIEAVYLLSSTLRNRIVVVCLGSGFDLREDLQQRIADLNLHENFRFLGSREDVESILTNSDIGLSASHEEGFSNSVLEMMAAGLGIIATDAGGNVEALVHKESGLIVLKNPQGDCATNSCRKPADATPTWPPSAGPGVR